MRSIKYWHSAGVACGAAALVLLIGSGAVVHAQVDVGPQVRIDAAGGIAAANETSIVTSDSNPLELVAVWNDWREGTNPPEIIRMGVGVSLDGGATWDDFVVRPPPPFQSAVEGDPMTAFDPRTGSLWVGAISFAGNGGVYVARKDPGRRTFEPSVMADPSSFADKCWMAAGPPPGNPLGTQVYVAYNLGLISSSDLGDTWNDPVSLGQGLGFLPRVGPNGELYVAYWDGGTGVFLRRSLNGGQTVSASIQIAERMDTWLDGSRTAGTFRVPPLTYLAVDPVLGTLYCVFFDTTEMVNDSFNVDLYLTRSTDRGDTWSPPVVINGDGDPPGDQVFPWLEVDRQGRLHLVFLDSRHTAQNDNDAVGFYDVYYAVSDTGGDSWQEFRLTPESFSSEFDGLDRPDQFLGDYFGLALGNDRVYPCYLSTQNGDPDIYTHVISLPACGSSDPCPDLDDDRDVDAADLALLLGSWGSCICCPADRNGDRMVAADDLAVLLGAWGGCQ